MSTYDHVKHHLVNYGYMVEGRRCHFFSSFIAGICVALVTSPIDVVKTRVMNVDPKKPAYNGMLDCFTKIIKVEGLRGFYKGVNA